MKTNLLIRFKIQKLSTKHSIREIKKILLEQDNFKISSNSICRIINKFCNNFSLADSPKVGRTPFLSFHHLIYIDQIISNDREITLSELVEKIRAKFDIFVSCSTVRRGALKMKWMRKTTR